MLFKLGAIVGFLVITRGRALPVIIFIDLSEYFWIKYIVGINIEPDNSILAGFTNEMRRSNLTLRFLNYVNGSNG